MRHGAVIAVVFARFLEKISEEIDVPIYGLNFDEDQAVAEKYEVDTIPTLLFFRDGKPVDSMLVVVM